MPTIRHASGKLPAPVLTRSEQAIANAKTALRDAIERLDGATCVDGHIRADVAHTALTDVSKANAALLVALMYRLDADDIARQKAGIIPTVDPGPTFAPDSKAWSGPPAHPYAPERKR